MDHFADWFASTAGVIQTFTICVLIIIAEHVWPSIDPNGFLLLYWLTVYSGITQPVLAFSTAKSAASAVRNESRMIRLERRTNAKLDRIAEAMGIDFDGID